MNNLVEKEILKNAQFFLKTNDSFKKSAFEYFEKNGIPDKITKYISPRFVETDEVISKNAEVSIIDPRAVIYLTNGIFDTLHSKLPDGITIDHVTFNGETFEDGLDALNAVAAVSPQTFTLKKNTILSFPITIVHNVTDSGVNKIVSPRLNFVVEENSEAAIIEVFTSQQYNLFQYTTNAFTSFTLLKNAKIEHVKIVSEAKNSLHIGWTVANLARDTHLNSTVISMGQVAANNNLIINLNDVGAETSANAVFTLEKSETNNIFTTINHKHSHTHSTQLCKGILKDESFGSFNGNIVVAPDAQEITSGQLSKNLLLSKKAHIDTRPQLLVSADDVKCSHGATVGQLSDEETFYLESRGISKARAKEMLMHGFSKEIIHLIKNKMIRDYCEKLITKK
jgi:Fe-S cluster assembly protein SufD